MYNFVFRIDVDTSDTMPVSVARDLLVKIKASTIAEAKEKIKNAFPSGSVITYQQYVLMQELPVSDEQ